MSRFIKRRSDKVIYTHEQETHEAIKKLITHENKVLSKVYKKAKKDQIPLSSIHEKLLLFAMREYVKEVIKPLLKK